MSRYKAPMPLGSFLRNGLPGAVAASMPTPELLAAWRRAVGPQLCKKAAPICLRKGGVLVAAVAGSLWRQEISLAAPQIAHKLKAHGVNCLELVAARAEAPKAERFQPRELEQGDLDMVEKAVAGAKDPELRRALADAMKAQLAAQGKARG